MPFDINTALQGRYDFHSICKDLDEKLTAAKEKTDGSADQIWSELEIFGMWKGYLEIFNTLNAGDYYVAWCMIEQKLIDATFLLKNFPEDEPLIAFVREHLMKLQKLFPYKLFISTVLKVKKEVCTICGKEISPWSECTHRPGMLYNGELCSKHVVDFEIVGGDIVMEPEHKYSVLFIQGADGKKEDNYNYSLLKEFLKLWSAPFQDWDLEIKDYYASAPAEIKDTDFCPCFSSFKTYAECCKKRSGILAHHYIFHLRPHSIQ